MAGGPSGSAPSAGPGPRCRVTDEPRKRGRAAWKSRAERWSLGRPRPRAHRTDAPALPLAGARPALLCAWSPATWRRRGGPAPAFRHRSLGARNGHVTSEAPTSPLGNWAQSDTPKEPARFCDTDRGPECWRVPPQGLRERRGSHSPVTRGVHRARARPGQRSVALVSAVLPDRLAGCPVCFRYFWRHRPLPKSQRKCVPRSASPWGCRVGTASSRARRGRRRPPGPHPVRLDLLPMRPGRGRG